MSENNAAPGQIQGCDVSLKSMVKIRSLAEKLSLAFISSFIALLLMEGGARLIFPKCGYFWQSNLYYGKSLIPNEEGEWWGFGREFHAHIKINSKGLRDREFPYEKPEDAYRILVLGDSFAEAMSVPLEKSFIKLLEKKLNAAEPGKKFEVINSGVSDTGTDDQFLFYKHEGYKYSPELVLLSFYIGNDVSDNNEAITPRSSRPHFVLKDGVLSLTNFPGTPPEKYPKPAGLKAFIRDHSQLYVLISITVRAKFPILAKKLSELGLIEKTPEPPPLADIYKKRYSPDWDDAWTLTKRLILMLKAEAEKNGAEFALLEIPDRFQIHPVLFDKNLPLFPDIKKSELDFTKPHRLLRAFCRERALRCVSLYEAFKENYAEDGRLLYYSDTHLNLKGHALAAGELFGYFSRRGREQ